MALAQAPDVSKIHVKRQNVRRLQKWEAVSRILIRDRILFHTLLPK